ncbi:MAG: pyridoxine 5'-phosphate synthase, partial [Gammaproteobacteria bacterium]|nr:pyridoxine 5'-phosphate synthase [Gammaproteobacteria bacterium]
IQDHDILRMAESLQTKLNFEMAATDEMRDIALKIKPADVCLVPEKREELTTEGGLDVINNLARLTELTATFNAAAIRTSLFIDPDPKQIDAAKQVNAPAIELHTGRYADAETEQTRTAELDLLVKAAEHADRLGLIVNAGHGLHYHNVQAVAAIPCIHELNIGHSMIARAIFSGLAEATREMKRLMLEARRYA